MAISKLILNGEVQMDVTSDTVTAGSMLSGTTATKNDGTKATGNIASKSSTDLTVSGATVTAPAGYYASSASKSVTTGTAGTPTATKGTVSNHAVSVTPSVTNTTGYITGGTKTGTAVSVSASELVSGTYSVTSSGTKDVTNYASASVPSGTEGTPTASKGTVSNHSVSVTPSVTNGGGYITGSTKTGTAVTVSASELVSGTKSISANGTGIDVTNYASVDVAVPTGGATLITKSITANGTYNASSDNADGYSSVTVNVPTGPACTVTITKAGSSSTYIKYNNTNYYGLGNVISVNNGEIIKVYVESGDNNYLYVNDVLVAGGVFQTVNGYDYTVTSDIEVSLTSDLSNSSAYITELSDGEPASKKQINFIDYDGTILHSYSKTEWQSVSSLPSNPSHSGLTAQGWNWTKAQIDSQLTAMPDDDVWIGQMYITDDGKTRIYIRLEEGRLHPYLGICPNGTVVVDWGDNSATSTLTGTSLTSVQHANHTYASGGDYVITLTVSSGSFAFYGASNTSHILKRDTTTTATIHRIYTNAIQKIELGSNVSIGSYAFRHCYSLSSITIPNTIVSIGTYAFSYCESLSSITIPNTMTDIASYLCEYCYSLKNIAIPNGIETIQIGAFRMCYTIKSITMPSTVTSIGTYICNGCNTLGNITIPEVNTGDGYFCNGCNSLRNVTILASYIGPYMFQNCYSLSNIVIPASVTDIGAYAFNGCSGVGEYHFLSTTPPTLADTTVFTGISSDCVIYVPSASLEAYQTATNWSTYASYIVGE